MVTGLTYDLLFTIKSSLLVLTWGPLYFKALFRRFTGGKSRKSNAEMQAKTPKMRRDDFRNTP